ncbi:phosphotransferase [Murinocardiopsis flavida]|nr:phosphotransferase [Murinocardiopsis flavida]
MDVDGLRLPLWDDPALRGEVLGWVDARLAARGARRGPAPPRIRVRPYSTAARFESSIGPVWFKATPPAARFEPALAEALAAWRPDLVLTPIGVDRSRGWLLLPDGGPQLRSLRPAPVGLPVWAELLAVLSGMQRDLSGRVPDLLGLGVPDLRPEALGGLLDAFLADPAVRGALGADGVEAVRRRRERFDAQCARLAEIGIAPSLDHGDPHPGSVFLRDGRHVLFDWGDASVAHPFATLHIPLRFAAQVSGAAEGDLARLRDAYLEPWTAEHPRTLLTEAARLAVRLAALGRALAWSRTFPALVERCRPEQAVQVAQWLLHLAGRDGADPR